MQRDVSPPVGFVENQSGPSQTGFYENQQQAPPLPGFFENQNQASSPPPFSADQHQEPPASLSAFLENQHQESSSAPPSFLENPHQESSSAPPSFLDNQHQESSSAPPSFLENQHQESSSAPPSFLDNQHQEFSSAPPSFLDNQHQEFSSAPPSFLDSQHQEPSDSQPSFLDNQYDEPPASLSAFLENQHQEPSSPPSFLDNQSEEPPSSLSAFLENQPQEASTSPASFLDSLIPPLPGDMFPPHTEEPSGAVVTPPDEATTNTIDLEKSADQNDSEDADGELTGRAARRRRRRPPRSKKSEDNQGSDDEENRQTEESEPETDRATHEPEEITPAVEENPIVVEAEVQEAHQEQQEAHQEIQEQSADADELPKEDSEDESRRLMTTIEDTVEKMGANWNDITSGLAVEERPPAPQEVAHAAIPHTTIVNIDTDAITNAVTNALTDALMAPYAVMKDSQMKMIDLMRDVDQSIGVCAMSLSGLNTSNIEQVEAINTLKDTMQNQTFLELGLNLNTLMETLSAALEPMKAVGELVPAIDQLVTTMERKIEEEDKEKIVRMKPDALVMNLADQLSAGEIDSWTFRCAYMAVFPQEHPADLFHRLVDLLGTQRLSGDLFRASYDAVQMAEPPRRINYTADGQPITEIVKVVQDEKVLAQLEELKAANEDLRRIVEDRELELSRRIDERESEYQEIIAAKEQEIQETQEMLHSRFEDFNTRYEELVETVNQRDEELRSKEDEVARKESEITMLKSQLDELQDQFKDTVNELQNQLTSTRQLAEDAAKKAVQQPVPVPAQSTGGKEDKRGNGGGFFEPDSTKNKLQHQMETFHSMSSKPEPAAPPPVPSTPRNFIPPSAPSPPTTQLPSEPSNQAIPRPQAPGIGPGGSYGNGVRAQVFEVIVRQALAGAPWREICAGPMQVNNIMPDEVEAEVRRREALLKK